MSLRLDAPVLIVGAGTFGLATAHQLASSGYSNITVLDRDDCVPSRYSAASDLNKIIRAEYADGFYTDMALEAIRKWQTDPLYRPHFRQTGFLNVTTAAAAEGTRDVVRKYLASIGNHPAFEGHISSVAGHEDVRRHAPALTGSSMEWTGYFNGLAGYCHPSNALRAVYDDCVRLGVRFHLGPENGRATELLYSHSRCVGAVTRDGQAHYADRTVVAAGASVAAILPRIGGQVAAHCWGVVHLQLSAGEAASLRGIPVTQVRDLAFFFEPDAETDKLKFCHMGGGFRNHAEPGLSLPYPELADSQFVPAGDVDHIRELLRACLPQLADRPLIDAHLCWLADADDSDFVFDYVPGTSGSLAVLSGDSGHGFKMLPVLGAHVQSLLETGSQPEPRWRWKEHGHARAAATVWRSSDYQELSGLPRATLS